MPSASDDEFGEPWSVDDVAWDSWHRFETLSAQSDANRPPKRRKLESSPEPPEIYLDDEGNYAFARQIKEDVIIDDRHASKGPHFEGQSKAVTSLNEDASSTTHDTWHTAFAELKRRAEEADRATLYAVQLEQSKSGEVENLRRIIDRTNRQHAEWQQAHTDVVAALRADLEEERKQRKYDAKRWHTEFAFKEQEIESTRRKRSRWNHTSSSQWHLHRPTVRRNEVGATEEPAQSPYPSKKGNIQRFRNPFTEAATPLRTTDFGLLGSRSGQQEAMDPCTPAGSLWHHTTMSFSLKEMFRILLTHCVAPSWQTRTLPMLLNVQLLGQTESSFPVAYTAACSELLTTFVSVLEGPAGMVEAMLLARKVCHALVVISTIVLCAQQTKLLVSALSLLAALSTRVRPLVTFVHLFCIQGQVCVPSTRPLASGLLAGCLTDYISSMKEASHDNADEVVDVTLNLLECLAWTIDTTELNSLESLFCDTDIFAQLLRRELPMQCQIRSIRVLTIFCGHKQLFRVILALTIQDDSNPVADRVPLVERLASSLDVGTETRAIDLHMAIFDMIALLAQQHPDAITLLTKSGRLLARLVYLIYRDTAVLFGDDGSLFDCDDASSTIRLIVHLGSALRLLHHLSSSPGSSIDICRILDEQPCILGARAMFGVGVGRLAFSDPPNWLPQTHTQAFEDMADAAQAILEGELVPEELDAMYEMWCETTEDEAPHDPLD